MSFLSSVISGIIFFMHVLLCTLLVRSDSYSCKSDKHFERRNYMLVFNYKYRIVVVLIFNTVD